jgi:Nickel responsive protein SCO4226-like
LTITPEDLLKTHQADLDVQDQENADFKKTWGDPQTGIVFCLSEAPSKEAVMRTHERAAPVHAGGLRYHGDALSLSLLVRDGYMEAAAYSQNEVFEAAVLFAKTQGVIPAPESAYAIRGAVNEAFAAREEGRERVILLGLSGHGHFNMQTYDDYLNDRLPEVEFDPEQEAAALARVPTFRSADARDTRFGHGHGPLKLEFEIALEDPRRPPASRCPQSLHLGSSLGRSTHLSCWRRCRPRSRIESLGSSESRRAPSRSHRVVG